LALNDQLKKIELLGLDTSGLYLKDKDNMFKEAIDKSELKKLDNQPIDIVVKFWHRSKTIKKTLHFHQLTGLQAVKKAMVERIGLKKELEEKGTITTKKYKTLDELWEEYIELKSDSLSANNIYIMKKSYDKWIRPAIGCMAIDKIRTTDIQNIVNSILRKGHKPRTAQTIKQLLRPLFKYAMDMDIVVSNPTMKVTLPSFDNTVDFQLSDDKRFKLYEAIENYEIEKYKGIMLFLYFGRRLNEALTLRWENILFDQHTYVIEDRYSKIRKRQEYPLLAPLESFLQNYEIQKYGFIFSGQTTDHVTSHTFRQHWKNVLKIAGIEQMRIHDTRHLLGNTMVNKGTSLEAIGKVLGHSSISVTKRYAKTSLATADKVLNEYLGADKTN
jgi:site-specific recombinase XerD